MAQIPERMRLDKWLWAARFYKTRALAVEEIERGRVRVNGAEVKPAREVKPGDLLEVRGAHDSRNLEIKGLSMTRGPAPVAALLYEESAESIARRAQTAEQRRLAPEPAQTLEGGRPTKRDRRDIEHARREGWGDRWSAGLDEG